MTAQIWAILEPLMPAFVGAAVFGLLGDIAIGLGLLAYFAQRGRRKGTYHTNGSTS